MFDTLHLHHRTDRITERVTESVNVNVQNAPTIESARLLKELEDQAISRVVGTLKPKDNAFQVNGLFLKSNFNGEPSFVGRFTLNGADHKVEVEIDRFEFDREKVVKDLFSKVAEVIARQLLMADPVVIHKLTGGR